MASIRKSTRLSIALSSEERHQIQMAAALQDVSIREYVLHAVKERLEKDFASQNHASLLMLSAETDPVLAALWDNEKDSVYDRL